MSSSSTSSEKEKNIHPNKPRRKKQLKKFTTTQYKIKPSSQSTASLPKTLSRRQFDDDRLYKSSVIILCKQAEDEMRQVQSKFGKEYIMTFLKMKLQKLQENEDDVAFVSVIESYRVAAWLTGNIKISFKQLKTIADSIEKYNVGNKNVVLSVLLYNLCIYYILNRKFGSAYHCLQKALEQMQFESPSTWSSIVYDKLALMNEMFAQIRPKCRRKFHNAALEYYVLSGEHYNRQLPGEDFRQNHMQQVYLKLGLPTLDIQYVFPSSHVIYERGNKCDISLQDVIDAEAILNTIKLKSSDVMGNGGWSTEEFDRFRIAYIFVYIRKAQIHKMSKNYITSWEALEEAMEKYKEWAGDGSKSSESWYQRSSSVGLDISTLLNKLEREILFHYSPNNKGTDAISVSICIPLIDDSTDENKAVLGSTSDSKLSDLNAEKPESESTP